MALAAAPFHPCRKGHLEASSARMSQHDDPSSFEELQHRLEGVQAGSGAEHHEALKRIRQFNLRPREVRDYLDRFVIKQAEAKKVLSVALCDHYNHVRQCLENPRVAARDYHKQNILVLGPTGVGKTYLMRTAARLIGVPFIKADATKFSETGYVGGDVEDLVRDLVRAAGGDVELAQYGIIYIDEIDKIAGSANAAQGIKDVSGRGVQVNLLKLMEETEVTLNSPTDMRAQMQTMLEMAGGSKKPRPRSISTKHILFIVSGAFDRLAESVRKRLEVASLGFGVHSHETQGDASGYLAKATTTDLIRYGFEPEFIGRLPVRVACASLDAEDLAKILSSSEGSILEQYKSDFKGYGIDIKVTPKAIAEIARLAHAEQTGARGLMTVFERVFRDFKFELPSASVAGFEVTPETVQDPAGALQRLIGEHAHMQQQAHRRDADAFAKRFAEEHGLRITFTDEALAVLCACATETRRTIRSICEDRFRDLQNALKIVARNNGQTSFVIGEAFVREPDRELSRMVVESFQNAKKV